MSSYHRTILIGLALVWLSLAILRILTQTPALAETAAKAKFAPAVRINALRFLAATESPSVTNPAIREDKKDRVFTVVQTQRVEAKLQLLPTTSPLNGSFQISISSDLPISDVLSPLTLSLQHSGQTMSTLLSRPAIQSDQWAIVTGTLQPSQTEWLLTVQNLATDPSTRLQISMTSQQGTITSVKVDPLVQVTQTTYIVTAPLPISVRLSGYAVRKVFQDSSTQPACEGMTMTWRVADGQNTTAPGISETITKSTTLSKVGASCVAQSVIPLSESVPSGRYTYTLQANWGDFTNQAQAVLEVVNPPTPTFTPTPIDTPIPTDTPLPTPCPTGQILLESSCVTITPTYTPRPTITPTSTPTPICPSFVTDSNSVQFLVNNETLKRLGDEFERICNVDIVTMIVYGNQYHNELKTRIEGGNPPDVFVLSPQVTQEWGKGGPLLLLEGITLPTRFKGTPVSLDGPSAARQVVGFHTSTDSSKIFVVSSETRNRGVAIALVIFLSNR